MDVDTTLARGGYDPDVDEVALLGEGAGGGRNGGVVSKDGGNPLAVIGVPIRAAGGSSPDIVAVLVAVGSPPGSIGAGNTGASAFGSGGGGGGGGRR